MLQESCAQPEVIILYLGEGLSFCRRTQNYCYVYLLRRKQDPALSLKYLLLLVSIFLSFPDKGLFEPALWKSGKVEVAERRLSPSPRNWGYGKDL